MTNKQDEGISIGKQISSLREIAGAAGFIGGVCFITGYLIVTIYLAQFGVNYLNLIQARYLSTGLLYYILSMLILIGPVVSYIAIRRSENSVPVTKKIFLTIINVLLIVIMIWMIGYLLTEVDRYDPFVDPIDSRRALIWFTLPISLIALTFPFLLLWFLEKILSKIVDDSTDRQQTNRGQRFLLRLILSGLFAICLLISLFVFAVGVYPNSSPIFGGGAPIEVQLLVADKTSLDAINIEVTNGLTQPLTLIDQTGDKLLLQNQRNQIIELSTSEIIAVIRDEN